MNTLLSNMQKKSEKEKAFLALVSAVVVTGLLFVVWGYTFAYGGQLKSFASSIVGVADVVENVGIPEEFSVILGQLKVVGEEFSNGGDVEQIEGESVGAQHINVFATPENPSNDTPEYGESPADVLY